MGKILWSHDWDWRGGERSHRRALELEPRNPFVLRSAGLLAYCQGHFDEAADMFARAIEQDPLSNLAYHNLGLAYHSAGKLAAGEAAYRRSLDLAPGTAVTTLMLALLLLEAGRGEEAVAQVILETDESNRLHATAIIGHALGQEAKSEKALAQLIQKHGSTMAAQIAEVYAQRGEPDRAFEWLERAHDERDPGLSEMKSSPRLRPLHGDPRWAAFMMKMGFDD